MLDEHKVERNPGAAPERHAIDPVAVSSLAETWTALFARLTGRGKSPAADADRVGGADLCREALPDALRAEAHAAFRSVRGGSEAAVDAALGVMERRIAELQKAVCSYGEALKTIQIYSADDASRGTARSALRAAPERLSVAPAAPHLPIGGRHV